MRKGAISRRFDPGEITPRLVSKAKGMDEVEERVAGAAFELDGSGGLLKARRALGYT